LGRHPVAFARPTRCEEIGGEREREREREREAERERER